MKLTTRRLPAGLGLGLFLAAAGLGCGSNTAPRNTTPSVAFGSHPLAYPAGSARPGGGQPALDDAVKAKYVDWKKFYLKQACGGYYVETAGGAGMGGAELATVSEGHGYGMMIVVLMAGVDPEARDLFDGLVAVRDKLPSPYDKNLMSWGMNADCTPPPPSDNDAATDGDLDAAFAFLLAEKQWGDHAYGRRARDIIDAIKLREMHPTTKLPLLGDWSVPTDTDKDAYTTTRLSDHMTDHFRAFAKATGDGFWSDAIAASYKLIDDMQTNFAPKTGLVPDFVKHTTGMPVPVPVAEANDPDYLSEDLQTDYDYNACRVPWRLGTDYLVTGDPATKAIVAKFNTFITAKTAGDASMIIDGYSLEGDAHTKDAGPNGCFTGGFGVASLVDQANQPWVDKVWNNLAGGAADDYYSDTIRLIDMIVMSGNWWTP